MPTARRSDRPPCLCHDAGACLALCTSPPSGAAGMRPALPVRSQGDRCLRREYLGQEEKPGRTLPTAAGAAEERVVGARAGTVPQFRDGARLAVVMAATGAIAIQPLAAGPAVDRRRQNRRSGGQGEAGAFRAGAAAGKPVLEPVDVDATARRSVSDVANHRFLEFLELLTAVSAAVQRVVIGLFFGQRHRRAAVPAGCHRRGCAEQQSTCGPAKRRLGPASGRRAADTAAPGQHPDPAAEGKTDRHDERSGPEPPSTPIVTVARAAGSAPRPER